MTPTHIASLITVMAVFTAGSLLANPPDLTTSNSVDRTLTHNLGPTGLRGWVNLALGCPVAAKTPKKEASQSKGGFAATDLFKEKFADKTTGIVGWGSSATPHFYVNPGIEELSLLKGAIKVPPHGVVVHPGADTDVVVGWQSPITGTVHVRARVMHGHPSAGDGVTWAIKHGTAVLTQGKVARAGTAHVPAAQEKDAEKLAAVPVAKGDGISMVIGRNGEHSCDTTFIEFVITEVTGEKRVWDLAKDVLADIQAGNPHADFLGNAGVWHFLAPKAGVSAGVEDPLAIYPWSPDQLTDGVRVVGGYSCDPVYRGSNVDEWVEIDLGAERLFHEIQVYPVRAHARNGEGAPNFPLDYTIETKVAGGQYATVKTVTNQVNPGIAPLVLPVPKQKARFVKIAVSRVSEPPPGESTYALRLAEVQVMGPGAPTPQKAATTPPRQHWRLQTDDTAMTLAVVDNQPAIWEWKNPRAGWNWLAAPAVIPLPTRVNVLKGKDHTAATWAFQEATEDATNGKKVTLRFTCNEEPKVQMTFIWWAAKGPGPIQYQEVVENGTGNSVVLWPQRDTLNLSVKPEREVVLWRFHKDAGAPAVKKALFVDRLVDGAIHEAPIMAGGQGGGYGFIPFIALDGGNHGVYYNGWWSKESKWVGDPERWPDGMAAAGRLAHENGFKLTLYFPGCGNTLDWGKKLSQCMTDYGVDTYRSDFGAPHGPGGIAMLDWLMTNHPNFRWENCECGGAYKDFVAMQRASVMFGIDVYDPLSNRKMWQANSYCIHPAQLQTPVRFSMLNGKKAGKGDFGSGEVFDLRSALQGAFFLWAGFSMPSDLPSCIPMLRENIGLYKTRLRPLIREANLYHIFLLPDSVDWDGIQYHDPVKGTGAIMLFKPNNTVDTRRIVLKGLDRNKPYALTFQDRPEQNTRKTGADLMDQGFDVTMTGQNVSEIVWVEETR